VSWRALGFTAELADTRSTMTVLYFLKNTTIGKSRTESCGELNTSSSYFLHILQSVSAMYCLCFCSAYRCLGLL
jgi:hypothetical protein